MRTDPDVMSSSPATIRSAVVLPHPDGPTKTIELGVLDLQVQLRDGVRPVRVDLRQPLEGDLGHARRRRSLLRSRATRETRRETW